MIDVTVKGLRFCSNDVNRNKGFTSEKITFD